MSTILVIDDDSAVRELVCTILTMANHDVVPAEDGDEGLRLFHESQPDMVITDIIMPGKEGLELIMALQRSHPDVPIMAMTGYAGGRFLQCAADFGAVYTLDKPFTRQALLDAVATVAQAHLPT